MVMSSAIDGLVAGRFTIEREVGRGGVGIVYRALDQVSGQAVALKVIAIPGVDAGEEARFNREGRVLAGLVHPGIVRLVAFGTLEEGGAPYVAMEWIEGEDIAQRMRRKALGVTQCLEVAAQIADALSAAHAAGIIHRDVKPSNVILVSQEGSSEGQPISSKLVDFGVASAEDAKLTRTGAIVGTPAYMAPEQARGEGATEARADLYALGATLFEMLSGRPPHVGPTAIAILARLVTTPAPRLSDVMANVPPLLDDLMNELLSTSPSDRPASAAIVAARLRLIAVDLKVAGDLFAPNLNELASTESGPPLSGVSVPSVGGSRLITSILATHVPKGPPRARLLAHLRARGAEATELGGDAIVAHLGARKALGDEAPRAIDLAMRLARTNAAVGVATGRTRMDRTRPSGEVVDRAAAMARDAQRGQVLADTTTTELARGRYDFQVREDGSALVGAEHGRREAVGGAPFVGREAELAQLVGAFERCTEDRTPVIATLTGAPGIGKTRLRRETLLRVGAHAAAPRIVLVRCETFGKSHTLGVAADVARGLCGIGKGATKADALLATETLRDAGAALDGDARELVARLMANEPLPERADARAARDALWMALTEIGLSVARRGPLVIGIEDSQWADAESLSWVDHFLGRAAGQPLWVMATARPGLWREDPDRFSGRDHVRVELRPLSRKNVRIIAKAMLGERAAGAAGEALAESIAGQSAGSPLFAEELARLAAQGRDATSAPTIEAAMQVHLDALDDDARAAAAKLSVFGLMGWDSGLAAIGGFTPDESVDTLRTLAAADVIHEQAVSRFKDTREWAFKHALMREVAYASLGDDALKKSHALAGAWLAKMGEDDATVARHLELGGESIVAAGYLEKAARRAIAAHALSDAVSMAERALAFAEDKPTAFSRAQLLDEAWSRQDARAGERDTAVRAMEESIYDVASEVRARGARLRYEDACGGETETSNNLEKVRREAQAAGLADEEARCAATLAARYAFAGELDAAAEVADRLLSIAHDHGIAGAAVDAWQTLAVVRQARGDVGAALEARRSAARTASEAGLKTREATLTINVGFALTTVGARGEARTAIEAGIAVAQAIGSPGTIRHGQMNLLCWTATFGRDPALDKLLEDPRAIADAAISGSWVPHDRATLGVLFYRGLELMRSESATRANLEAARTLLRTAAQGYQATKMLDVVPVALGRVAESERRCGNAERARELAREAAALLDEGSPSLLNEAPVFLALHDACVDLGDTAEAREAIARGIPRLVTRLLGLSATPYALNFLQELAPNAGLVAAAKRYGLVPPEIQSVLDLQPDTQRTP
jgi:serine/threonine protein kinase/tetratricopeptide (TPR) repeat protein